MSVCMCSYNVRGCVYRYKVWDWPSILGMYIPTWLKRVWLTMCSDIHIIMYTDMYYWSQCLCTYSCCWTDHICILKLLHTHTCTDHTMYSEGATYPHMYWPYHVFWRCYIPTHVQTMPSILKVLHTHTCIGHAMYSEVATYPHMYKPCHVFWRCYIPTHVLTIP